MSNQQQAIGVGIIGFGFMGQTHASAYRLANDQGHPCKIIAVADSALKSFNDLAQESGNIGKSQPRPDYSAISLSRNAHDVIHNPDIDLVSICTHTDTHVDLAIQSLQAGKHVLVEKPIALTHTEVERLSAAAENAKTICLPAMCMRFWPAWIKIHEAIKSDRFGTIRSAVFHRLGTRPNWGTEFYTDESRSGGVLHDLHIHDTDFIVHCFGVPDAVTTKGKGLRMCTNYHYSEGPAQVAAHAAWDQQPEVGFQMRCVVTFENAIIDFDINRAEPLILYQSNKATPIATSHVTGYDEEIRYILDRIAGSADTKLSSMNDAVKVAHVLDAERQSLLSGMPINLNP